MNSTTGPNHNWADNARWCADQRYFLTRNDSTKTCEDLDNAYTTWEALSVLSAAHRDDSHGRQFLTMAKCPRDTSGRFI